MSSGIERRVFYRSRITNGTVWTLMAFASLYFLSQVLHELRATETSTGLVVIDVVLMLAFLIPALRFPVHGVVATASGVAVRNILRTHVLRWNEIDRFELGRYDPWPRVGVAVLHDGTRIPMTGVQYRAASPYAQETVAALNDELAKTRPVAA